MKVQICLVSALPCLVAIVCLMAPLANAAENPSLPTIRQAYSAMDFERCLSGTEAATKMKSSSADAAEVSMYRGLCQFALGRRNKALTAFKAALAMDSKIQLPPLQAPKVKECFDEARTALGLPLSPQEAPATEALAQESAPRVVNSPKADVPREILAPTPLPPQSELQAEVERPPKPSAVKYVVPAALGAVAVAAGAVAVGFGVSAKSAEANANSAAFRDDYERERQRAQSSAQVSNASWVTAGVFAAGAIITAFVLR
jgi:hypothetical protein